MCLSGLLRSRTYTNAGEGHIFWNSSLSLIKNYCFSLILLRCANIDYWLGISIKWGGSDHPLDPRLVYTLWISWLSAVCIYSYITRERAAIFLYSYLTDHLYDIRIEKDYYRLTTCKQNKPRWFLIYHSIVVPHIYFCFEQEHEYLFSPRASRPSYAFVYRQHTLDILTEISDNIIYNFNNILCSRACWKSIQQCIRCYYYNTLYGETYVGLRRKLVLKLPKPTFLLTYKLFNLWKLVCVHQKAMSILNRWCWITRLRTIWINCFH